MNPEEKGQSHPAPDRSDGELLVRGLEKLGLAAGPETADHLLAHAGLVRKWTLSYNLVAPRDRDSLIGRHVLDSLAIHPFVGAGALLDVGSGAGFPGVPLAIAMPGLEVTVLDSSGKKARFLAHVKRTLRLENLEVVHARAEAFRPGRAFGAIISRAFSSLSEFAGAVRHLATPETRLLAMKGRLPGAELDRLPDWLEVRAVERITVPDLHAERHLVIMSVSPEID